VLRNSSWTFYEQHLKPFLPLFIFTKVAGFEVADEQRRCLKGDYPVKFVGGKLTLWKYVGDNQQTLVGSNLNEDSWSLKGDIR